MERRRPCARASRAGSDRASSQESTRRRDGLTRTMSASNADRSETWRRAARRPSPSNGWFDLYSYVRGAGQSIVAPSALRTACLPSSTPNTDRHFLLVHSTGSPLHLLLLRTPSHPRLDPPCNAYVTAKTRRPDECPPKQVPKICTRYVLAQPGEVVQIQYLVPLPLFASQK